MQCIHVFVGVSSEPEPLELLVVTIHVHKDDADKCDDDKQQKTDANDKTNIICNSPTILHCEA